MQLQLRFTPSCVDGLAIKILIKRIRPDYPDLDVETTRTSRITSAFGNARSA